MLTKMASHPSLSRTKMENKVITLKKSEKGYTEMSDAKKSHDLNREDASKSDYKKLNILERVKLKSNNQIVRF